MTRALRLLALVLLAGCGPPSAPNLDSPGSTIVCLGDSLTAGVGRGVEPSYPEVLADRLGTEVLNAGVPGDTADDGLARLDEVLALDPWLVVVALGGNDLLRQVPLERTEAALRGVVEGLLQARITPVLVEVRGPFGGRYRRLFHRLEEDYGIPLIEGVLPDLLSDARFKSDPIHLNGAGYRALGEAVAKELRPLLARRRELR